MILQALYGLYHRLLADPDSGVSPPGHSAARVSFALNLSADGVLLDVIDLRSGDGKAIDLDVPRQIKRSSGVRANFLCDNGGYILGVDNKGKPERTRETHDACLELHREVIGESVDHGAQAVLSFLATWDPAAVASHPAVGALRDDLIAGGNIVFRLDGTSGFIHQRPALRALWARHIGEQQPAPQGQCLVTGLEAPIARLHDNIKGVVGAQPTGAALVSFNLPAFTSYGKTKDDQSLSAPVSEEAAFGYTTALNYLLRSDRYRLRIGDATTVFWAERAAGNEVDILAELLDPFDAAITARGKLTDDGGDSRSEKATKRDPQTTRLVHDVLQHLSRGIEALGQLDSQNPNVTFYLLGIAPNSARLAIRFWHVSSFGALTRSVSRHYLDTAIVAPEWERRQPSIRQILKQVAPLGDISRAPAVLAGPLTRAVLQGTDYPQSLYTAMLSRLRADQARQDIDAIRAGVIKACLLRRARTYGLRDKERMITVSLNEQCLDSGYLLGRAFALLEKAQQDANPGINATIRDRYFGAASATPQAVFPILLRLSQHHLAKAEYGAVTDRQIESVLSRVTEFPAHLDLEGQGMFVLGYYQQRQSLYQKKADKAKEE